MGVSSAASSVSIVYERISYVLGLYPGLARRTTARACLCIGGESRVLARRAAWRGDDHDLLNDDSQISINDDNNASLNNDNHVSLNDDNHVLLDDDNHASLNDDIL